MKKEIITKRQKELLSIIYEYVKDIGYPPTFEEMRERLNVSSNQSIMDLLKKLKDNGIIKQDAGKRTITILPIGYQVLGKLPLMQFLGATSAGSPIEAIEVSGEWKTIPSYGEKIEKLKGKVFLLKVLGDSMINAGINDGDTVLVKEQGEFISGDIVLAKIGDESTVKRFISEDKSPYIYLKPENPKYPIILFTDETELKGKVISVLKNDYWKQIK